MHSFLRVCEALGPKCVRTCAFVHVRCTCNGYVVWGVCFIYIFFFQSSLFVFLFTSFFAIVYLTGVLALLLFSSLRYTYLLLVDLFRLIYCKMSF